MNTKPFRELKQKTPNFLITTPRKVAAIVRNAIENNNEIVYINNLWRIIMFIIKFIPEKIFKRLSF